MGINAIYNDKNNNDKNVYFVINIDEIYNLRAVETVEEGNDELLVDPVVFVRCEVALVMERVTP